MYIYVITQKGYTALMFAANYGLHDTIELLLQHGADITLQDNVSNNYT